MIAEAQPARLAGVRVFAGGGDDSCAYLASAREAGSGAGIGACTTSKPANHRDLKLGTEEPIARNRRQGKDSGDTDGRIKGSFEV